MTIAEMQRQLEIIKKDRLVGAHHDDIFFTVQEDMEALERVDALIKFLAEKSPAYHLTVAEILAASNIDTE